MTQNIDLFTLAAITAKRFADRSINPATGKVNQPRDAALTMDKHGIDDEAYEAIGCQWTKGFSWITPAGLELLTHLPDDFNPSAVDLVDDLEPTDRLLDPAMVEDWYEGRIVFEDAEDGESSELVEAEYAADELTDDEPPPGEETAPPAPASVAPAPVVELPAPVAAAAPVAAPAPVLAAPVARADEPEVFYILVGKPHASAAKARDAALSYALKSPGERVQVRDHAFNRQTTVGYELVEDAA